MKKMGLTPRMAEVLALIEAAARDSRPAPTFQEIMDATGLKSKSNIHRLMLALEERGHIHRLKGLWRGIGIGINRRVCCPHCKERFRISERVARPE